MKRLLLDLGNTRLKWRLLDATATFEGAHAHDDEGFTVAMEALGAISAGASAWLASVAAHSVNECVVRTLSTQLAVPLQQVRVAQDVAGLHLAYADPAQLGVDRWLAMLAAVHALSGPRVIALAGTALTLDAVDAAGRHLGGLIAPGLALQRKVLTAGPLFLAEAAGTAPTLFAESTAAAVESGPPCSLAALIERFAAAVEARCGAAPGLLISGGDAGRLQPLLREPSDLRPQLVLDGLERWVESQARGAT